MGSLLGLSDFEEEKDRLLVCPFFRSFEIQRGRCGKGGPTGSEGYCIMTRGRLLVFFSRAVMVRNSNEAEVLAILEALRIFSFMED